MGNHINSYKLSLSKNMILQTTFFLLASSVFAPAQAEQATRNLRYAPETEVGVKNFLAESATLESQCLPPVPTPYEETCCSQFAKFCYKPYTNTCNGSKEMCNSKTCGYAKWIDNGVYDCDTWSTSEDKPPSPPTEDTTTSDDSPCLPMNPNPGHETCCTHFYKFCDKPFSSFCNLSEANCKSSKCGPTAKWITDGTYDCYDETLAIE